MTTNVLRRKKADAAIEDDTAVSSDVAIGVPIGEIEPHVFACPDCGRPLSDGTSRCPGCGVRLILGVPVKRAGAILALGLVVGFLFGGVVTAAATSLSAHATSAAGVVDPTPAPVVTAVPGEVPVIVGAPQAAVSALSGTAVVNGRISVDSVTLSKTLADRHATSIDIARAVRSLSADAALGTDLVSRLAPWHEAGSVGGQLGDFYRTMSKTATVALRGSLNDVSGYRHSAAQMQAVLVGLGDVDSASRTLAATVGLELAASSPAAGSLADRSRCRARCRRRWRISRQLDIALATERSPATGRADHLRALPVDDAGRRAACRAPGRRRSA